MYDKWYILEIYWINSNSRNIEYSIKFGDYSSYRENSQHAEHNSSVFKHSKNIWRILILWGRNKWPKISPKIHQKYIIEMFWEYSTPHPKSILSNIPTINLGLRNTSNILIYHTQKILSYSGNIINILVLIIYREYVSYKVTKMFLLFTND